MSTAPASFREKNRSTNSILGIALVALLIAALLLPPISLGQRLTNGGMTTIPAGKDSNISDPDGTRLAFPAAGVPGSFNAKLVSIPRETFANDAGNKATAAAANALIGQPLLPRSPFYMVETSGAAKPTASIITMEIPNDSLPYETLDLYEWTGSAWRFLPNHEVIDQATGKELILSELDSKTMQLVPPAFMVMQTEANPPTAALVVPAGTQLPEAGRDAVTEASPYGLTLNGDGSLGGNIATAASAGGSYQVAPVLRNWDDDGVVRTDLLDNLLISEEIMTNHLNAIEALVVGNNLPGIELDYRGLDPTLSTQFSDFVNKLAERMHTNGRTLALRVETPTQVAEDRWSTGGYDWRVLGQAVDIFRIPAPIDPKAYVAGGAVDQLLSWSVGEVERRKVDLVLPARSVEKAGSYLLSMGYDEALTPLLGESRIATPVLVPGEPVDVTLFNDRLIGELRFDDAIGMFTYDYRDNAGYQRTVWIENAASLARKLELVGKYNLKGSTLEALLEPSYDADLWSVVREFLAGKPSSRTSDFNVVWTVTDATGKTVAQEERPLNAAGFSLTAPEAEGQVKISASIADNGKPLASGQAIALEMATATPTAAPTPETPPTPTPLPAPTTAPTPDVASVVATRAVNVRSGPGTAYNTIGQMLPGQTARLLGKNQDGTWWQIEVSGAANSAWVIAEMVSTQGPVGQVQVAKDIPAPQAVAAVPTAAPAPSTGGNTAPTAAPAPTTPAVVSAPAPSGGGAFGYGMQVNPYDNGFLAGKIRGMGFNWVKFQLPWKDFEGGGPGQRNWPDGTIDTYNSSGLNILVSIVKSPNWARPGNTNFGVEGPPADPATYASFVGAFAGRYCGRVQAIEVWNEQNLWYEWGNQTIDAAAYMALLKQAYAAIKAACPSTKVISGALTPTGAPAPWAMDDFAYLEAMYQNGLKNYADGIGAHPSGFNVPPDATSATACAAIQVSGNSFNGPCDSPHHSWSFRSTMEGYRAIMAKYGDTNKRIWPTEFGWAAGGAFDSNYRYADDNSYEEQAEWTVRAYQLMKNWGWVGPAFLWNLNFRMTNPGTELAQWGILDSNGGPLPVYNALAAMPK
ncbi:MAG: SH3 domain-containing protein [Anaerolineae bacterium]